MKKMYTFIMLVSFGSLAFVGCGSSKNSTKGGILGNGSGSAVGGTVVKTVATVVGIILLSKIIKSVLGTVGGSSIFGSQAQEKTFAANFNESTKLSSFANNDLLKAGLQVLVAEHYKIPIATVASNYKSFNTVEDLATFIGKNADAKVLAAIK